MLVINTQYARYINSPEWRKKRRERLDYDNRQCTRCESGECLEVHHLRYERLGNERLDDLRTLCQVCHAREHGRDPELMPVAGLSQRALTERGNSKYWLERWQKIIEKALVADQALYDLRAAADSDADWIFDDVGIMLAGAMQATALRWGRTWMPGTDLPA